MLHAMLLFGSNRATLAVPYAFLAASGRHYRDFRRLLSYVLLAWGEFTGLWLDCSNMGVYWCLRACVLRLACWRVLATVCGLIAFTGAYVGLRVYLVGSLLYVPGRLPTGFRADMTHYARLAEVL